MNSAIDLFMPALRFFAFVARRFLQSVRRNSHAAHRKSVGSLVAYGQVSQKPFRGPWSVLLLPRKRKDRIAAVVAEARAENWLFAALEIEFRRLTHLPCADVD